MGPGKKKPDAKRVEIGRADQLYPVFRIASSALAFGGVTLIGADLFTSFDLVQFLIDVSVSFTLVTIALTLFRIAALIVCEPEQPLLLKDAELPTYTVLVPLFREAHMVEGLVNAISETDYPNAKLDVIFICEETDPETVNAAMRASDGIFRTLVVPPPEPGGDPQTKPRALNYALALSDGDIVTIYDAEDRPAPHQLRQAASAIMGGKNMVAVQAPLQYFNTNDSSLSAQFGLEYDGLFRVLLPFYAKLGLPFPLGGTSNHMRRDALEAVGGWDAHNVTEDADLAFRLCADGSRIGWIDAPTLEEAVNRYKPWVKQRSRWLKGFMVTYRVHMKHAMSGGWRRFAMLQLSIGLSLMSIVFFAPVLFYLSAALLAQALGVIEQGVAPIYILTLLFCLISNMAIGAVGVLRSGRRELLWHVPLMPYYWLLLLPPFLQAAREFKTCPSLWHKTEHGVTGSPL